MDTIKVPYILVYTNEKRFGKNKPKQCFNFYINHMEVHMVIPRKPLPLLRQMQKASRSMKPMQAYTTDTEIFVERMAQLLVDQVLREEGARKEESKNDH